MPSLTLRALISLCPSDYPKPPSRRGTARAISSLRTKRERANRFAESITEGLYPHSCPVSTKSAGGIVTAKSYDPTLKALVETEPSSWPAFLGQPRGPTKAIDADIATVSGAADKVLRVQAETPYLLHLEFVAGHDVLSLQRKLVIRNSLLEDRHELPVRSAVLLLRPEANSPRMNGVYQRAFPGEEVYLLFRYSVVRIWEPAVEPLLTGGLALLPLAPISAVTEDDLPGIIRRMERRLSSRRARKQAEIVWAASYILFGLRYSPELSAQLFRGVLSMNESSTYQAILEGAVAEARKVLRLQGTNVLGKPNARMAKLIDRLQALPQLEELLLRVHTVSSWQELLGVSASGRRTSR